MSRIGSSPVIVPSGVEVKLEGQHVSVKGSKGALQMSVHAVVEVKQQDGQLSFSPRDSEKTSDALTGYDSFSREQHGARRQQMVSRKSSNCRALATGPTRKARS